MHAVLYSQGRGSFGSGAKLKSRKIHENRDAFSADGANISQSQVRDFKTTSTSAFSHELHCGRCAKVKKKTELNCFMLVCLLLFSLLLIIRYIISGFPK